MSDWQLLSNNLPQPTEVFLLEWDNGGWVKAWRSSPDEITIEWHNEEYTRPLEEVLDRLWFRVPTYQSERQ